MVAIPFLYFLSLFCILLKKHRRLCVGTVIMLFYIFSFFFAIIIVANNVWQDRLPDFDPTATFIFCALITLSIYPFYRFNSNHVEDVYLSKKKVLLFCGFCWGLIILNIISVIALRDRILETMVMSFASVRADFYRDAASGFVSGDTLSMPWYQYLLSFAPVFSPIMVLFFFWSSIHFPSKKLMNALLLVCSSFAAVISLLTASRTQVVYWAMMFIVIYMLFKNMFSNKLKKLVLTGAIAIGSLGVTYFTIVTIARFENTSLSAQEGLVSYIGQPYLAFTNVYNHYTFDKITLNRTFPVTSKWVFGDKTFNITDYRERQTNRIGADTNVFYTYLGDAMLDYGKVGMILYSLLFYFICSLFFSSTKKRELSLSKMIVLVLLLRVPTLGLFAYMYASVDYSVLLFGSLFMAFLLK